MELKIDYAGSPPHSFLTVSAWNVSMCGVGARTLCNDNIDLCVYLF